MPSIPSSRATARSCSTRCSRVHPRWMGQASYGWRMWTPGAASVSIRTSRVLGRQGVPVAEVPTTFRRMAGEWCSPRPTPQASSGCGSFRSIGAPHPARFPTWRGTSRCLDRPAKSSTVRSRGIEDFSIACARTDASCVRRSNSRPIYWAFPWTGGRWWPGLTARARPSTRWRTEERQSVFGDGTFACGGRRTVGSCSGQSRVPRGLSTPRAGRT